MALSLAKQGVSAFFFDGGKRPKPGDQILHFFRLLRLALPNGIYVPISFRERTAVSTVAHLSSSQFGKPIFLPRHRNMRQCATVLMPKASVDKQHGSAGGKYQVWVSGQIAPVQPKAKPLRV